MYWFLVATCHGIVLTHSRLTETEHVWESRFLFKHRPQTHHLCWNHQFQPNPAEKLWSSSVGMITFPIYGKKSSKCSSHHQPDSELIRILPDGFTICCGYVLGVFPGFSMSSSLFPGFFKRTKAAPWWWHPSPPAPFAGGSPPSLGSLSRNAEWKPYGHKTIETGGLP